MELKRKNILTTFTVLSLASAVMIGFQYVGKEVYYWMEELLNLNQEAGGFRWLSWLFHSQWTDRLVQYFLIMGAAYIPIYLMIMWLPKDKQSLRKLSGRDFVVCTVTSMGLGYICNIIGTFLNLWISNITGASFMEMNPVMDMMESLSPAMIIYSCILGPFMEELLCRGWLLKRARVFGDWTAVVFTAVVFGLMHGNLAQFLYATVIGLVFGYVAVKTNSIRYTVLMHLIINTYNVLIAWGEIMITDMGAELLLVPYTMAILLIMLILMICGVVCFVKYGKYWYRQMLYHNGKKSEDKIFVYLNPGFVVYLLLCLVEFVYWYGL